MIRMISAILQQAQAAPPGYSVMKLISAEDA